MKMKKKGNAKAVKSRVAATGVIKLDSYTESESHDEKTSLEGSSKKGKVSSTPLNSKIRTENTTFPFTPISTKVIQKSKQIAGPKSKKKAQLAVPESDEDKESEEEGKDEGGYEATPPQKLKPKEMPVPKDNQGTFVISDSDEDMESEEEKNEKVRKKSSTPPPKPKPEQLARPKSKQVPVVKMTSCDEINKSMDEKDEVVLGKLNANSKENPRTIKVIEESESVESNESDEEDKPTPTKPVSKTVKGKPIQTLKPFEPSEESESDENMESDEDKNEVVRNKPPVPKPKQMATSKSKQIEKPVKQIEESDSDENIKTKDGKGKVVGGTEDTPPKLKSRPALRPKSNQIPEPVEDSESENEKKMVKNKLQVKSITGSTTTRKTTNDKKGVPMTEVDDDLEISSEDDAEKDNVDEDGYVPSEEGEGNLDSDDDENSKNGTVEYVVQKILKKKMRNRRTYYLLQWKGFSKKHNTWEPKQNLNCVELIEEFEKNWSAKHKDIPKSTGEINTKAGSKRGRGAPRKSKPVKKSKVEDSDSDSDSDDKRDEDEPDFRCILCNTEFSHVTKKIKKWTLATSLDLGCGLSINVYEGLTLFYQHFRILNPLSVLEPIKPINKEDRQLCQDCASSLGKFCNGLKLCVEASNKNSLLSKIAGDLDEEKVNFRGPEKEKEEEKSDEDLFFTLI